MVLALGTSMPVSMIVVHSSTLKRWLVEVAHHLFEFALVHLPVGDARCALPAPVRAGRAAHVLDRFDFVVQEVHLAAALQFAQHRLADHAVLFCARTKVLIASRFCGARGDDREIAHAFQRHAQRARNRRGGQRQHVDFGAQRLQRFLLAHAEAVFFVDDHQPEPLELDVGLTAACACRSRCRSCLRRGRLIAAFDFLGRFEARQFGDAHRPVGEAVGKVLVVLLGEQRGRRQNRDLLAAHARR